MTRCDDDDEDDDDNDGDGGGGGGGDRRSLASALPYSTHSSPLILASTHSACQLLADLGHTFHDETDNPIFLNFMR